MSNTANFGNVKYIHCTTLTVNTSGTLEKPKLL